MAIVVAAVFTWRFVPESPIRVPSGINWRADQSEPVRARFGGAGCGARVSRTARRSECATARETLPASASPMRQRPCVPITARS
jgi:hypothetical protein